ncbi:hypothetical protein M432DRAFT_598321 [Thermoascus aurantiacus ATCC 26904]
MYFMKRGKRIGFFFSSAHMQYTWHAYALLLVRIVSYSAGLRPTRKIRYCTVHNNNRLEVKAPRAFRRCGTREERQPPRTVGCVGCSFFLSSFFLLFPFFVRPMDDVTTFEDSIHPSMTVVVASYDLPSFLSLLILST